jgi:hypothetical protein
MNGYRSIRHAMQTDIDGELRGPPQPHLKWFVVALVAFMLIDFLYPGG